MFFIFSLVLRLRGLYSLTSGAEARVFLAAYAALKRHSTTLTKRFP